MAFDLAALRARLSGNDALIWRLLDLFAQRDADAPALLRRHIERGDLNAALMRVHDLKGCASNLSAVAVTLASVALETALRTHQPTEAALGQLQRAMAEAIAALPALRALR